MRTVQIAVGHDLYSYSVDGETAYGPDERLIDKDDNLIRSAPWREQGYTVDRFLKSDHDFEVLVDGFKTLVHERVQEVSPATTLDAFSLEQYHLVVPTQEAHLKIVMKTREGFPLSQFPIDVNLVEERVSELCGVELTAISPRSREKVFFIRIIRPSQRGDANPPHRDVWLDRLRDAVNIYVPIAGSNVRSSLPLVPGSHLWSEAEIERTVGGAKVDGSTYRVPAVTGAKRPLAMIRPDPRFNEILVFSPYLVHGGGVNLNTDATRVSLEMRFWRRPRSGGQAPQS